MTIRLLCQAFTPNPPNNTSENTEALQGHKSLQRHLAKKWQKLDSIQFHLTPKAVVLPTLGFPHCPC